MPTFSSDWSNVNLGKREKYATLYTAAAATDDGEWIDMSGAEAVILEVNGITTGTLTISGTNDATIPANSSDETTIDTITADGFKYYDQHQIPRFMKFHITVATSIALNADIKIIYSGNAV